jgi:F-type H+-transporting ATPase subunit a
VLTVFFLGTAYLVARPLTIAFAAGALALSVLMVALEIFIAAVQAYVFAILTAAYISQSVSHEH